MALLNVLQCIRLRQQSSIAILCHGSATLAVELGRNIIVLHYYYECVPTTSINKYKNDVR